MVYWVYSLGLLVFCLWLEMALWCQQSGLRTWLSLGAVLVAAADIGSHRESAGDRITELVTLSAPQQQVLSAGDRKKYLEKFRSAEKIRCWLILSCMSEQCTMGQVSPGWWQFVISCFYSFHRKEDWMIKNWFNISCCGNVFLVFHCNNNNQANV